MLPKAISESIVGLIINEPFYAHILSRLKVVPDVKDIPIAAVRLKIPVEVLINTEAFEELPKLQRIGVLKHEIMHLIMEHFMRQNNRDRQVWNMATDLAINSLLPRNSLPEGVLHPQELGRELRIHLPQQASAEEYYAILEKEIDIVEVQISNESGHVTVKVHAKNRNKNKTTFREIDTHPEEVSVFEEDAVKDVNREIIRETIREIIGDAIKQCGDAPGEVQEYIDVIVADRNRVNWRRVLSRFLMGRGRMIATPTYTRESKRFEFFPGRRKTIGMEALVAVDTSGSMSNETLQEVLTQLLKIKKISGTKIWVTWGDVRREGGPIPIEKVGTSLTMSGRGGTDLRWPFEMAAKMRIPVVVYFTDGYGPAPGEVPQKVLWVITTGGIQPTNYGISIHMEDEGKKGRQW